MDITVNKGVELINLLQHLSDCKFKRDHPECFEGDPSYIKRLYDRFEKYKDYKYVKLYSELTTNGGYTFTGPISLGLSLDNDYKLAVDWKLNETMQKIVDFLPKFAEEIDFDSFFEENQDYYDTIIEEYRNFLDKTNYQNFMKTFYKTDYIGKTEKFVLIPSLGQYNMCITVGNQQFCGVTVAENVNEHSYFVGGQTRKNYVPNTALHEFSHPIVNPLVNDYFKNHPYFEIDNDLTRANGAYKGVTVIHDTIIEAVVNLYLKKRKLYDVMEDRIQRRGKVGFTYIRPLVDFIEKNYFDNIDKFSSFSQFFGQIMEELLRLKEKEENQME